MTKEEQEAAEHFKELGKLQKGNAKMLDRNIDFVNKMISKVPADKRGEFKDIVSEVKENVKNRDMEKLMKMQQRDFIPPEFK